MNDIVEPDRRMPGQPGFDHRGAARGPEHDTSDPETLAPWLALNRVPGLGPVAARRLIDACGGIDRVFADWRRHLEADALPSGLRRALAAPDWAAVERDLAWLAGPDHGLLTPVDPKYPPLLGAIPDPPLVLFFAGNPAVLTTRQLAVVGSRAPTPAGRRHAWRLAAGLAERGMTVTSGLALGIDAAAHRGALEAGGTSVAVLGHGPETCYPRSHAGLLDSMVANGVVVTEFGTGATPRRHHFPQRNRIISGLSVGVLVVEARRRSGSMSTVREALAQGREVCAVPGAIDNPLAEGPNRLLRDGARLVAGIDDLVEEFDLAGAGHGERVVAGDAPARAAVKATVTGPAAGLIASLGDAPRTFDQLLHETGLTPQTLSSMLMTLELQGAVVARADGTFLRC